MPYTEKIMVAEGNEESPGTEQVKLEDVTKPGEGDFRHCFKYEDNRITGAKNFIPFPYQVEFNSWEDYTVKGIAFREPSGQKGKIVANGTATGDISITLGHIYDGILVPGNSFILSGCPEGGSDSSYYLEFTQNNVSWKDTGSTINIDIVNYTAVGTLSFVTLIIKTGTTLTNAIFAPMLCLATDMDNTFVTGVKTNRELCDNIDLHNSQLAKLSNSDTSKINKVWAGGSGGYPSWRNESELNAGTVNGHMLGMNIDAYGTSLNRNVILCNDGTWKWAEDQIIDFTSDDVATDAAATTWNADVSKLTSHSTLKTLFNIISKIASNVKFLYTKSGGHSLGKDVPANAVFTDTTYPYSGKIIDANYKTQFRTQTKGDTASGHYITNIRCNTSNVDSAPIHSAGLAWGVSDTHGYLMANYNSRRAFMGGGNADKLNWVAELAFKDDLSSYQPKITFARFKATKTGVSIAAGTNATVQCTMESSASGYTFLCAAGYLCSDKKITVYYLPNDSTRVDIYNMHTSALTITVEKFSLWYK